MTDEVAERRFEAMQRFAHPRGEQHQHDERGDQHDDIGGPAVSWRACGNGEEASLQQPIGVDLGFHKPPELGRSAHSLGAAVGGVMAVGMANVPAASAAPNR